MTSARIQELSTQLASSIAGKEPQDVENLCRSFIEMAVREAGDWRSIETPPIEHETVLTIHSEDLFPVCAHRLHHGGKDLWLREIEGPEDDGHPARNEFLYRPPTHWMPLPNPPTP